MACRSLQGTVTPHVHFNAEEDANTLKTAMKGVGTNQIAIVDLLAHRSNTQRIEIKQTFKTMFGKDLEVEMTSELSGKFRQTVLALLETPINYDIQELHRAMKGAGTDEDALVEILCTRSNDDIAKIKAAYKLMYRNELEKDLIGDTSGHFRRLLVSLCTGNRSEDAQVDMESAKMDAQELYAAGEEKLGTDESVFNKILCSRSCEHIQAVVAEYSKISQRSLEQAIDSEMSGDLRDGMKAVLEAVCNKQSYFARRLHWSMKGLGTNDDTLIRVVVSRCEVDMVQIKDEFQRQFGKTLDSFITDDTSGDYKDLLLYLIGAK